MTHEGNEFMIQEVQVAKLSSTLGFFIRNQAINKTRSSNALSYIQLIC